MMWLAKDVFGIIGNGSISPYILDLVGSESHPRNSVAVMAIVIIGALFVFYAMMLFISHRYDRFSSGRAKNDFRRLGDFYIVGVFFYGAVCVVPV